MLVTLQCVRNHLSNVYKCLIGDGGGGALILVSSAYPVTSSSLQSHWWWFAGEMWSVGLRSTNPVFLTFIFRVLMLWLLFVPGCEIWAHLPLVEPAVRFLSFGFIYFPPEMSSANRWFDRSSEAFIPWFGVAQQTPRGCPCNCTKKTQLLTFL